MSEEDMATSYEPTDEINKTQQLKHYRQVCSEVIPEAVYISSYQVASNLETLRKHRITHIVNTAGDICDNCFPDHFKYVIYYLKDTNSEDISVLFYRTLEWMHNAVLKGGRVLVHCREGVSRSATMVIAYLMWKFNISFDVAHERLRNVRPICNPNTGFTCQLLIFGKKLGFGVQGGMPPVENKPQLFRVAPHHPKEPLLLLLPAELPKSGPIFDQRFGWVVQRGSQLVLWLGSQVPDAEAVQNAVRQHAQRLETFERCRCTLIVGHEGEEPPQLWQALDLPNALPDHGGLAATRPSLDSEFEILRALAAKDGPG